MKKLKWFVILLITLIYSINLNAGVTIKKIYTPASSTIVSGERAQFAQYLITTDEADSIERVLVEIRGATAARNVFKQVVMENGFGRIVGSGSPLVDSTFVWVNFEQTVILPENPLYLSPKADVNVSDVGLIGANVTLVVKELRLSNGLGFSLTEAEGTGTTHHLAIAGSGFGNLTSIQKLGGTSSVFTGQRRFLGGFMIGTGAAEDFSSLPNIQVHLSGGQVTDIGNFQAVILTQEGNWYLSTLYRETEYSSQKENYYLGDYISFRAHSTAYVGVFGDLGESFSSGNSTIAISTNPAKWKSVWGRRSGKELSLPEGIVIGPSIKVVKKPTGEKG